ncbi:MAG: hypothetical protein NT072_09170 [Deltaproteobacteria bacterium]|nr:hypothetical protein [Deltaproteobacteria bacterium]
MNYSEKYKPLLFTLCILIFIIAGKVFSQDQNEVQSSFKKKAGQFEKFFLAAPKLLEKETFITSPTGHIFYYQCFKDCKISYDVQKTDSSVSPYMGYIFVVYKETRSNLCGDFMSGYPNRRCYTTAEEARKNRDHEMCYDLVDFRSAKFVFAFEKKWVFKDVTWGEYDKPHVYFLNALGKAPSDRFSYVEDNDFWKELIE